MARSQDHYARRAKSSGYPARSVFKLQEIDGRFHLLKKGDRVLDIGTSPGSWSMYAADIVGTGGAVVGVDIKPEKPHIKSTKYTFIQGDAFTEPALSHIKELAPFSCVLSDAAPSTTGNRTVDTARSYNIVEQVILLATSVLEPGGSLVTKLFQGGDEGDLLAMLRERFKSVRMIKPKASRKESFEVFLVATGLLGF